MRTILYIGDFKESYATENYIAYGLEQLGCRVFKANENTIVSAKSVLGACQEYDVDFVLFSKGHFNGADQVIELLRENGIRTVGWIFDLFFDTPTYYGRRTLKNASFRADICCMTDGGHQEEWKKNNVNHRTLRQGIHLPEAYISYTPTESEPIKFVGTKSYEERIDMIDSLIDRYGPKFAQYGLGSKHREVRGTALNNLLAGTSVVVGDSMPSPMYWSNRIYEILGRGGFLLHPYIEGLETEFKDGVHYVSYEYGNYNDLYKKIDYYLAHPEEREQIRTLGHLHVKKYYSYTNRCTQLLAYVDELR